MEIVKLISCVIVLLLGLIGITIISSSSGTSGSSGVSSEVVGNGKNKTKVTVSSFNTASPAAIGYAVPVTDQAPVTFDKYEDPKHTKERLAVTVKIVKELMKKSSVVALQEAHAKEYKSLMKPELVQGLWEDTDNVGGTVILFNKNLYEPYVLNYDEIKKAVGVPEHLIKLTAVRAKGKGVFVFNVHMLSGQPKFRRDLLKYLIDIAARNNSAMVCVGDFNSTINSWEYSTIKKIKGVKMYGRSTSSYSRFAYTKSDDDIVSDGVHIGYGKWERKPDPYHPIDLAVAYGLVLMENGEFQIPAEEDFVKNETPYANPGGGLQTVPNYSGWSSDHAAKVWCFEIPQ
jgi:hypothetical protein